MAVSIAPVDNPFEPVVVRGRIVQWLAGDTAWEIIDPFSRTASLCAGTSSGNSDTVIRNGQARHRSLVAPPIERCVLYVAADLVNGPHS